jgi:hypothetical protein
MNRKKSRTFPKIFRWRPGKNLGQIDPGHDLFKPSITDFTLDGSAHRLTEQLGSSSGFEVSRHIGRMNNSESHNISPLFFLYYSTAFVFCQDFFGNFQWRLLLTAYHQGSGMFPNPFS